MKVFTALLIYMFIAGLLAGAVENDMRSCRALTRQESSQILYLALLWPELIGAAVSNDASPPYPKECDNDKK